MSHFVVTVAVEAPAITAVSAAVTQLLAPFDEDLEVEQVIDEDNEITWRNPDAKWDWWQVGGRYSGRLPLRAGAPDGSLLRCAPDWDVPKDRDATYCDGACIRHLDFERARSAAATAAASAWDEYAMVIVNTPPHRPWSEFDDRVREAEAAAPRPWLEYHSEARAAALAAAGLDEAGLRTLTHDDPAVDAFAKLANEQLDLARSRYWDSLAYTLDRARADYAAQPRITALRAHEPYQSTYRFARPEEEFDHLDRDEYVQLRRDSAIPGFATLTHTGNWLAPGRVGWFGMSDDTHESQAKYLREANDYLDSLPSDLWLVTVDCHI